MGRGDAAVHRRAAALIPRYAAALAVLTTAICVAAAFIAATSLAALDLVGSSWLEPRSTLRQSLIAAASLVPLLIALRLTRSGPDSVGLTRTNLGRSVAIGAALAAAWLLATGTLGELLKPRGEHLFVLVGALAVGFSEEVLYRGYLQSRLIDWIGARRGVALAATIFALIHIPQRLLAGVSGVDLGLQLLVVAVLGGVFGVLQASTRNVALPGIVHIAIDWSTRFSTTGR